MPKTYFNKNPLIKRLMEKIANTNLNKIQVGIITNAIYVLKILLEINAQNALYLYVLTV